MASTFYKQLNYTERRTFKLHLLYSIIEGYILGILALNEFVFIRSMKGSDYQLSILFQLTSVLLIFAIVFHELQIYHLHVDMQNDNQVCFHQS